MAETPLKRRREETQTEDSEETKRHQSYNRILSLLEEEEDEPTQDLSSLITTLQQELSSDSNFDLLSCPTTDHDHENHPATLAPTTEDYASCSSSSSSSSSSFLKEDEEDDKERVIRHLLEASDDELGLPNREAVAAGGVDDGDDGCVNGGDGFINGVEGFSLCDGLWEFEDVNANYYTMLQSELFM